MSFVIRQQNKFGGGLANASSFTITGHYTLNTLAGSLLLCLVTSEHDVQSAGGTLAATPVINPPTTPGVTWVLATQHSAPSASNGFQSQAAVAIALYYAAGAAPVSSATNTSETATATAPVSFTNYALDADILLYEITGAGALDAVAPGAAGLVGTTPNAGVLTTAQAEFVLVAFQDNLDVSGTSAGSGFVLGGTTALNFGRWERTLASPAGAVSCTFAGASSGSWAAIGSAFLPLATAHPNSQGFLFGF